MIFLERLRFAVTTLLALWTPLALQADDFNFVTKSKVLIHSKVELSAVQKRGFRKFARGGDFFGAFFIDPGGDAFTFMTDLHNVKDAILVSEQGCRLYIKLYGGKECALYATIEAISKSEFPGSTESISKSLAQFGKKNVYRYNRLRSGFIAISATRSGVWAISEIKKSEAAAIKEANRLCRELVQRNRQENGKYASLLSELGLYRCTPSFSFSAVTD
ncbi:hypothetical protein [Litoreibacter halocynthiae]|uniref:hypothetical protein n=1 Tax=Litoreibacter halocynthiae TaxID=1242689 RepID=UPI0024904995|nr:hypothetical protein [Litoreibacter halocynthiae]